jgi:hypothetical protein
LVFSVLLAVAFEERERERERERGVDKPSLRITKRK